MIMFWRLLLLLPACALLLMPQTNVNCAGAIPLSGSFTLTCAAAAMGTFTLAPSAAALTVAQGAAAPNTIAVVPVNGFTGMVMLSVAGLPAGVTASFGTNPAAATSALTLTVAGTATAGTYKITVNGTSGGLTASTAISLTVTSGCVPVSITPYLQVNQGVWQQVVLATVASGSVVNLGPQPLSGGTWSWAGPAGFSSAQREIDSIPLTTGANTFAATFASGGCSSTQNFVITVTAPVVAAGYYVAPNGNDAWSGTLPSPSAAGADGPFKSLAKAQAAMQSGTVKTVSVRGGVYQPPATTGEGCNFGTASAINLTPSDSGETWQYYPPDGFNSAIIDGGATSTTDMGNVPLSTLACGFASQSATNITINGLQFRNWAYSGIAYGNEGATPLKWTVTNNTVHDTRSSAFGAAAIFAGCSTGSVVAHNYVYNAGYHGIEIGECGGGGAISNVTVSDNFIDNVCIWSGDCAGVYGQLNGQNSNVLIGNNYIRNINVSSHGTGSFSYCCSVGVYLDAWTYNVKVSGNVMTGVQSSCVFDRGGGNIFTGNICDIGTAANNSPQQYILDDSILDGTKITGGRAFQHNIVVAGTGPGSGYANNSWTTTGTTSLMGISINSYFNYGGTALTTTGSAGNGDTSPTYQNPGLSCWAVKVASTSPSLAAPVSFPALVGNWGPPGFVVPQTGVAPSWPHAC